ncbi:MAG: BrnT family toxin [Rubellimicrobium sp.]|nr:BrnT family toxin [Rubellimicrobium sp.]
MEFEWDEEKREATLRKHGIDFLRAAFSVFGGPHLRGSARSDIEPRETAIGEFDGVIVAIIFTMRGESIRIITARRARRHERENYGSLFPRGDWPVRGPH